VDGSRAKSLDVGAAAVQGFSNNIRYFKKQNIEKLRNGDLLPSAFNGTQQLDIKTLLVQSDFNALEEHESALFVSS